VGKGNDAVRESRGRALPVSEVPATLQPPRHPTEDRAAAGRAEVGVPRTPTRAPKAEHVAAIEDRTFRSDPEKPRTRRGAWTCAK